MKFTSKKARLFVCAAVGALFVAASGFAAFAGEARINFSDPEVAAGDTVNVSMKITSDDGTLIGSSDIMLSYPTEKLEFVSGTDTDGGAGALRVHGTTNGGGTSVVEYNLSFKTVSAGSASIAVESYEIYDTSDDIVTVSHVGSSSVTIDSGDSASSDATLSSLDVYPGELTPAFSPDISDYSVSVGLSVSRLTINAVPGDSSSQVTISGNEDLPDGDSTVSISVNASDGVSSRTYSVLVSKVEGGPENILGEAAFAGSPEGVQLSSKGKTITVMTPADDVEIPEGLTEGTIMIDDQKVVGWVLSLDEEPEYCVVYGMNDSGELNFYRYDLNEKTIQRFFSDPLNENAVTYDEYSALNDEYEAASDASEFRLMIILILAAFAAFLLILSVYLYSRISALSKRAKEQKSKEMKVRRTLRNEAETERDLDLFMPENDETVTLAEAGENSSSSGESPDETHVIRRSKRRRRTKRRHEEASPEESFDMSSIEELSDGESSDASSGEEISGPDVPVETAAASDTAEMPEAAGAEEIAERKENTASDSEDSPSAD